MCWKCRMSDASQPFSYQDTQTKMSFAKNWYIYFTHSSNEYFLSICSKHLPVYQALLQHQDMSMFTTHPNSLVLSFLWDRIVLQMYPPSVNVGESILCIGSAAQARVRNQVAVMTNCFIIMRSLLLPSSVLILTLLRTILDSSCVCDWALEKSTVFSHGWPRTSGCHLCWCKQVSW